MLGQDYEDKFDPVSYLQTYYKSPDGATEEGNMLPNMLKLFHEEFQKPCHLNGSSLLDFGSGPCITSVISASQFYCDITLSDYSQVNRQQLQKWASADPQAHDWKPIITHITGLDGKGTTESVETRVRTSIKDILPCDAHKSNPLEPVHKQYDCVTSSLCLETCGTTLDAYRKCVKNVSKLVKPGGLFVNFGVLGETFYLVNDLKFFALKLSSSEVRDAVVDAGFVDVSLITEPFSNDNLEDKASSDKSDFEGYFILHAKKL